MFCGELENHLHYGLGSIGLKSQKTPLIVLGGLDFGVGIKDILKEFGGITLMEKSQIIIVKFVMMNYRKINLTNPSLPTGNK